MCRCACSPSIEEGDGPNQILRENAQRRIVVYGNGDGRRDMAAIVADIRRVVAETQLPQGYTTQPRRHVPGAGGSRAADRPAVAGVAGADLHRALQPLQSTVLACIILANIPLALIGSVDRALMLAGQPLSVASMIGFITLAGISARNGILKISHYINLALHEGEQFGPALVMRGSWSG